MGILKSMIRYINRGVIFQPFPGVVLDSMIKLALMKTFLSRKIKINLGAARKRQKGCVFLIISFGMGRFILVLQEWGE